MGILKAVLVLFRAMLIPDAKPSSLHQPPIPTPRAALEHNLAVFTKLDQAAAHGRVAMPGALDDLLLANPAGLLKFGKYPAIVRC